MPSLTLRTSRRAISYASLARGRKFDASRLGTPPWRRATAHDAAPFGRRRTPGHAVYLSRFARIALRDQLLYHSSSPPIRDRAEPPMEWPVGQRVNARLAPTLPILLHASCTIISMISLSVGSRPAIAPMGPHVSHGLTPITTRAPQGRSAARYVIDSTSRRQSRRPRAGRSSSIAPERAGRRWQEAITTNGQTGGRASLIAARAID
jgi:hypothetical protein